MTINVRSFDDIDLNLMVVFIAIYDARSVSRAAQELGVGQPAVSGSLSRLRARFDDPLFERRGSGMQPTAKAHAIALQLTPAIRAIESILALQHPSPQPGERGPIDNPEVNPLDIRAHQRRGAERIAR